MPYFLDPSRERARIVRGMPYTASYRVMLARRHGKPASYCRRHFSSDAGWCSKGPNCIAIGLNQIDFRNIGYADKIIRTDGAGWYRDNDCGMLNGIYRGHVFQIPARKGSTQYLAAVCDEDADTMIIDATRGKYTTFDTKEDAARAADELARILAEHDREFTEAYSQEQAARGRIDDAMIQAASVTAASREQRKLGPVGATLRGWLADRINRAREELHDALNALSDARRAIDYAERRSAKWWGK